MEGKHFKKLVIFLVKPTCYSYKDTDAKTDEKYHKHQYKLSLVQGI